MQAGISTACFYPEKTEEALLQLSEWHIPATEVFLNTFSELEPAYLRELKRIADAGGVKILSIHPFTSGMEPMLFFSKYKRRFEDGLELYRRYYQAANILGGKIVVFHGNYITTQIETEEYFNRFGLLMEDAKKEGALLCHENVSRCAGHSPVFFRQMSSYLPEAKYVFDIKQAVRSGENVLDFVKLMGKNIIHLHISDHNAQNDCLAPGKGTFNISEMLHYCHLQGFCGGALVELYRENYGQSVELLQGFQLLSRILSTIA